MTLLIGLLNHEQAILVSDRRLTRNGVMCDDESNKATVFQCADGRFAVAFTGLAEWGPRTRWKGGEPPPDQFVTRWWLLSALADAAPPDYLAVATIERFRQVASKKFSELRVPLADKALSVMFTGYTYDESPRACGSLVSNVELNPDLVPSDTFTSRGWREKRPGQGVPASVHLAGATTAVTEESKQTLFRLLEQGAPAATLTGKAVQLVRQAAAAPATRGLIGAQCTSICLPADPAKEPTMQYHTAEVTVAIHGVSFIVARGPGDETIFAEPEVTVRDTSSGAPLPLGPKIGRNKACWCNSGKKYKKCHGASGRSRA